MIRSILAIFILVSITISASATAEPGDKMHVTINVKVKDLTGPPQTANVDVCTSKSHDMRIFASASNQKKHCEVSDYKLIGSSEIFHETCSSGPMQMNGEASFTLQPGEVHGTIHTELEVNGQKGMTTDTTYDGAVTGSCDYTPPVAS